VMSNHFHLSVEAPLVNLSAGMHYLQSVFSNRFNKFVGERGHVFQGRYKSWVLEGETALLQVVDYIHLNPVRTGLVTVEDLKAYRLSSFPAFFQRKGRPKFLDPAEFLHEAGGLSDSPSGMKAYHRRLKLVMEEDPVKREKQFAALCRGWDIGSAEGKAHLAGQIQDGKVKANTDVLVELEEVRWDALLRDGLKALGKKPDDYLRDRKLAEWKLALGAWLKSRSGAGNRCQQKGSNLEFKC